MQAIDIMTSKVISVSLDADVRDIAQQLLAHRISAVPVVDADGKVVGIVSEGDLMRRITDTSSAASSHGGAWWLSLFAGGKDAGEYVKAKGKKARDVMTPDPLTIEENMPLHDIARLLEKHRIKRVPVVREGKLVGIVSRANLLQGIANAPVTPAPSSIDDRQVRDTILNEVDAQTGVHTGSISITVNNGHVEVWGLVESQAQKQAVTVAAENTPGVHSVANHLGIMPRGAAYF
ncbi:CBS domain-containing protein [Vreelandella lutescens]|uniref:Histidine kinase n=1 Tax=Vreelandella lutescens TaxID=1602943 RepID=A0ABQ1NHQ0_9GAMM|nr:CBS domain-containing protein [Halomonas lutescens]GGC77526.1 histidine kinase [Halomonas lutescens]